MQVFIPVSNSGHLFLLCFNLKYPAVSLIDGMNTLTRDGYRKHVVVTHTNDIIVSSILVCFLYLYIFIHT